MRRSTSEDFDVIIVGGGIAGLSAALLLGRSLRRVLVCDAGHPRNAASPAMHCYLGLDGINPGSFLQQAREDLKRYSNVDVRFTTVTGAVRNDDNFRVIASADEVFTSRALLLATGIKDTPPDIPLLKDFYGTSIHTCPYCDAWEHRDQPIGVLGNDKAACDLALELLIWSGDVTLYTNEENNMAASASAPLTTKHLRIAAGRVSRLEGKEGRLSGLVMTGGELFPCRSLFILPTQRHQSALAEALGCQVEKANGAVICGPKGNTGVNGLFVAGNLSKGVQLAMIAASEGVSAAVAINEWLLEADLAPGD